MEGLKSKCRQQLLVKSYRNLRLRGEETRTGKLHDYDESLQAHSGNKCRQGTVLLGDRFRDIVSMVWDAERAGLVLSGSSGGMVGGFLEESIAYLLINRQDFLTINLGPFFFITSGRFSCRSKVKKTYLIN